MRLGLIEKLKGLAADVVAPPTAEEMAQKENQAQAIIDEWKVLSNDPKWFDDGLNAKGVSEAVAAGLEVGAFFRSIAWTPELLVTSPFRRAWQTQMIGFGEANFKGVSVLLL